VKVLGVSGSPRPGGNTDILVNLALKVLAEEGIQTEFLSLADRPIKPCMGCAGCVKSDTVGCVQEDPAFEGVVERFVEKVRALEQGPAKENYTAGAVINEGAKKTILEYIQVGKGEGRLAAGGEPGDGAGHYIQPTVYVDVERGARIAQEEIFGPVVSVMQARDFEDALDIANGTEYGLTGAVFSRDPLRLAKARREFMAGNLYLNRKCTGALVGVHPFGGFNMSGTDAKVGGPDYLLYFLQPKVVSIKHQ